MSLKGVLNIRKIFRSLRGGESPGEIATGVCLGVLLGLMPWGIHILIPVLLLLFFQCSTGMTFFFFGLTKGFYLLTAPLFFRVGYSLLGKTSFFDGTVRYLRSLPFFGLMPLNNYLVFGSIFMGILICLLLFPVVYFLVKSYREKIEVWITGLGFVQKYGDTKILKFSSWLLFGPSDHSTGSEDENKEEETNKTEPSDTKKRLSFPFGFLRIRMILFVVVLFLVFGFVAVPIANAYLPGKIQTGVNSVTGSTSSLTSASFSLFQQRFVVEEFSLADPKNNKKNMFEADRLELSVSIPALLAGRLHINNISATGLRFHSERREDGSLNVDDLKPVQPEGKAGEKLSGWLSKKGKEVDWYQLIKKYLEYYQERKKEIKQEKEQKQKEKKKLPDRIRYATKELQPLSPTVSIDKIALEECIINVTDSRKQKKEFLKIQSLSGSLENLSSHPTLMGKPILFNLEGTFSRGEEKELTMSGAINPELKNKPQTLEIKLKADKFSLTDHREMYQTSLPVHIENGNATFEADLNYSASSLNVPVQLALNQLALNTKPNEPRLFGLDEQTSRYVVKGINAYAKQSPVVLGFLVSGTPASPKFHWKGELLKVAREGLVSLGKEKYEKFINNINGELDSIKSEAEVKVKDKFKNLKKGALESVKKGDTEGIKKEIEKVKEGKDLEDLKDQFKDLNPFGEKKKEK